MNVNRLRALFVEIYKIISDLSASFLKNLLVY